jgi:outer membrane protein insertion porin family
MTRSVVFALFLSVTATGAALAQQLGPAAPETLPIVESVSVAGNQFLDPETLLFYVSTKPGERYDERRLKDDFRRLWDTGFLEDLVLRVNDGPKGKVVIFQVAERKRIQIVDFRGNKSVTNTNIEDELKKKEAVLKIDTFFDPAKARKVEGIIKDMLAEKGHPFATVKYDAKTIGGAGQQVSFVIDEGPKTKVKSIEFTGNKVFSGGKLRGRMKKIKPAGFWNLSWLSGKTTYTRDKWEDPHEGDRARLEDLYLNHGYVTAEIGEPKITYTEEKKGKKPRKWMHIEIPVTEGDQYRVGDIKFDGLTVFKEEGIRPMFKLKTGDVYNDARIRKGYDKLRDLYGSLGYFQWTGLTRRTPDPQKKVVDVVLAMEEDKRYYLGKIKFVGNDTTRDKVIRREVYMNEGDVFNTEALKMSIKRINQLGYFKPMEGAPELSPSPLADDRLDVTFKVEEQNRNQFTFGGGVSGLEGTFINASFSTANFLGMGETFQVSAQSGRRTKNYQFAVTEPYLFDRPITAGFDLYKRRLQYDPFQTVAGYTLETTGASLISGFPLGRFTRVFLNYAYEIIRLENIQPSIVIAPGTEPNPAPVTPVFDPFFLGEEGRRRESRFTPSFVHNTVDNPWQPTSGGKHTLTLALTGGPLGGTVNFFRPDVETIFYLKHTKKTSLGLRGEFAYIRPFGTTTTLPLYQRFFLGGETQIRGYNVRTVGPIDATNHALGGNKFVLFNAEYYIDIGGPLRLLFFYDAGQAFLEGESVQIKKLRTSTGAELRFIMPVLNVPFRLIYAWNPNRDSFQPKSTFKFAVGTTF